MSTPKNKYTMVAAKAVSLAELFAASFARGLEGPIRYRVELSAPEGPSTAGGKQALQHIKLIPDTGPTVVIGSADTTTAVAEVRTFDHLAALHAQRFRGAPVPIDAGKYNQLAEDLSTFFRGMNMKVSFLELGPGTMSARQSLRPAAARSGTSPWLIGLLGALIGVLIVSAAYYVIFLR